MTSEPKGRGADWTEERGTSDEGRRRLEGGPEASEALLEVRDVTVHHGQLRALDHVSLQVYPGEVYAIIGANGAGKSTLLRTIAGLHQPTEGSIVYDGRDMTRVRPERRATQGIVMVPEGRRLFGSLTVEENLQVGATYARKGPWTIERVYELFGWMTERRNQRTAQLSGGEQQSVAIGRALVANPRDSPARRAVPRSGPGSRPAHLRHAAGDPGRRAHRAAGRAGRQPGAAGGDAPAVPARGSYHPGRQAVGRHAGAGRGRILRPGYRRARWGGQPLPGGYGGAGSPSPGGTGAGSPP